MPTIGARFAQGMCLSLLIAPVIAAEARAANPRPGGACTPSAALKFVCGAERPEDLALIPGTRWLIVSGFQNGAGLKLVDTAAGTLEHWFAAYTCSSQEKRVAQHLSARRIEYFLPFHRKISRWKNGLRILIEKPLFPGYIFVKIDSRDKVRVLELPGVHSIVGAGRQPISLPYEEIEALRRGMLLLNPEPHPLLRSGEKVLIRKGPLVGMTGIVVRQKNSTRVILTLELILRSISVEVDEQDLEFIDHDKAPCEYLPPFEPLCESALR